MLFICLLSLVSSYYYLLFINEISVMRLSKQKRIAADYSDRKSSALSSFLKAVKAVIRQI